MKNIFLAFTFLFFATACDDGDIEIASFEFANASVKTCQIGVQGNFYLYIIKDKRVLILKIPEETFNNVLTTPEKLLTIDSNNKVIYREYVGNAADDNICGFPTNVTLGLEKEWNGVGGTIKIETSIAKSEDVATGISRYATYNHRITLINPSFSNGAGGEQKMDLIEFGTYSKVNENNLNESFGEINATCNANKTYFFKTNAKQSLELLVQNTIFDTTILDTPKTRFLNGTTNKFTFKVFNGNVLPTFFCATSFPTTPAIVDTWIGRNGASTSGIIEVITSSEPGSTTTFNHKITLKNVTVEKGALFFNLGNTYELGTYKQI